jgi:5-oxoprolinase (ATP-hydrolysing) subunit C
VSLRIVSPGLYTILADAGRPGSRSLGVPVGGAADRWSLALGNALVGNPPETAALEFTLTGPTVQADCELACVVYGAPFTLASDRQRLSVGTTFTLQAGEELRIGITPRGLRAYLCVRGGFRDKKVLGSQSSLAPLAAGTELNCCPSTIGSRLIRPNPAWNQEPRTLRVLPGTQADWFRPEEFYPQEFRVTDLSNRMGLRLQGQPLTRPDRELLSEPVSPGAVQVTRDGQSIVLGVDGQTIGGYPKIAQVVSADLDKLGQLRPGDGVRFQPVSLEDAEAIYRQKQAELRVWVLRLGTTLGG